MTNVSRQSIKNTATMAISLALGSAAGLGSMMVPAAVIEEATTAPAVIPNEPAGEPGSKVRIDRSGQKRVGKASFYADRYSGKTMADGTPMKLYSNNAASMTLPLGTTARVTNLETGRSAIVIIRDRGPYVRGRIVDLSPATAKLIGLSQQQGVAEVEVTPVTFPNSRMTADLRRSRAS